ncbi:MAG: hypothetical protein LQ352_008311 [Teloschistes flavicans]|nr:MAG: hypothetical protein LQ352_008311 [Teloschistes flavicans]
MSAAPASSEHLKPGNSTTSSPGLSSPPSPRSPPTHQAISYPQLSSHFAAGGRGDSSRVGPEQAAPVAKPAVPKQRKPRKKKEPAVEANLNKLNPSTLSANGDKVLAKVKKPRLPRTPAIVKKDPKFAVADLAKPPAAGSNQMTDHYKTQYPYPGVPPTSAQTLNGKLDEAIPTSRISTQFASPPRPTSGQNYDPIRSATIEPRIQHPQQQSQYQLPPSPHARTSASTPPRPASHASISPSIASLLEPHPAAPVYNPTPKRENEHPVMSIPEPKRPRLTPPESTMDNPPRAHKEPPQIAMPQPLPANPNPPSTIDVDSDRATTKPPSKSIAGTKKPSNQSSASHSPKPSGRKEAAIPPLPPGNGLLSSAMLGVGYDSNGPGPTAPTVILHVPLNGDTNKYINFARLAEEKYGFDALHPRLAAQRDRLARVAAAGAALENAHKTGSGRSADEMSVDHSDGEADADNSNVEMGGVEGNPGVKQSEAEGSELKKRRKRTMKEDMYDKDDPFVDDSEMAFEEQAAATKDGFFVYSGPLVPEGEKAVVERADGAPRGGGRGRGRGRGSRGGATGGTTRGSAGAAATSSATLTKSGQPRKKRVTKQEKADMEQEKAQRENMAPLAAKPTNYPG